jgi:hypothetical protein
MRLLATHACNARPARPHDAFRYTKEELVNAAIAPPNAQVVAYMVERGRQDALAWVKQQGL